MTCGGSGAGFPLAFRFKGLLGANGGHQGIQCMCSVAQYIAADELNLRKTFRQCVFGSSLAAGPTRAARRDRVCVSGRGMQTPVHVTTRSWPFGSLRLKESPTEGWCRSGVLDPLDLRWRHGVLPCRRPTATWRREGGPRPDLVALVCELRGFEVKWACKVVSAETGFACLRGPSSGPQCPAP